MAGFPEQQSGVLYLTEGGQETELMYKHGHELPEFAMYPLLDDRRAVADLTGMYTRYLEVAAEHGFVALMGGLDYRASPDWASKLGISIDGLAEFQLRSIEFLREVARPFEDPGRCVGLPVMAASQSTAGRCPGVIDRARIRHSGGPTCDTESSARPT